MMRWFSQRAVRSLILDRRADGAGLERRRKVDEHRETVSGLNEAAELRARHQFDQRLGRQSRPSGSEAWEIIGSCLIAGAVRASRLSRSYT